MPNTDFHRESSKKIGQPLDQHRFLSERAYLSYDNIRFSAPSDHCLAGHIRRKPTGCKQTIKLQAFKGSSWDFHDQFSGMSNNFACCVNELTTEGISVDGYRNDRSCDIFLEGFEQAMAHAHHIIPGCVSRETLEGQLLMTKGFQRSVDFGEYIAVMELDNLNIVEGKLPTRCEQLVREWAKLHQKELVEMWNTQNFHRIEPLE